MKKTLILAAAASTLFALSGCTKDAIEPINPNTPDSKLATISASTAPQEDETRTSLSNGNILWTEGDQIALRLASDYKKSVTYTLKTGAGTAKGTFEGEALPEGAKYALYPMSIYGSYQYSTDRIGLLFPEFQFYKAGSFGNGVNPMVAKSDAAEENLAFLNLCGAIRLKLTGSATIKRISVTSAGEWMAGDTMIDMTYTDDPQVQEGYVPSTTVLLSDINETLDPATPKEFTIILPPGAYASGMVFSIETSDGKYMNKVTTTPITVKRSKVLPLAAFEVVAKAYNFPDKNFRKGLKELGFVLSNEGTVDEDIDINNETNKEKFNSITEIDCNKKQIASLKGIEYFTALKILNCSTNQRLTSLDLSANTALTELECADTQLTSLDLSANTALTRLNCIYNNQLTSLKLPATTALTQLSCNNTQLTSLDLSANTALKILRCPNTQLTSLDLSANTALTEIYCDNTPLTSLDLSANTALTEIYCDNNKLNTLNLSANTALTRLHCINNPLVFLDLTHNTALTEFSCSDNRLTSLDLSANTALTSINCNNNQLTSLDLSANTALTSINCNNNQLTSLDLSAATALTSIYCDNNRLTSLDLSANTALNWLTCNNNQLTSLDLTHNTIDIPNYYLTIGAQVAADGTLLDLIAYVSEKQTSELDTSDERNARATLSRDPIPTPAPARR